MKKYFWIILICASIISCSKDSGTKASYTTGKGGSMARFAIIGNNLYTVDNTSLNVYDVSVSNLPNFVKKVNLSIGTETIFPYKDKLFIGTNTGMYIYDVSDPLNLIQLSHYAHVFSCDPVVVDDNYAYVTLRGGNTRCSRGINVLEIVNIKNLREPILEYSYPMQNPKGLGIDGNLLFICDEGLKIFDATDVRNLKLLKNFKINAWDIIPNRENLMVIGEDGLYQYNYSDTISLLSRIPVALTPL